MNIENKLKELGIDLPEPPSPIASYTPCKQAGNLVFVSGQGPIINGKQIYRGKVGAEISLEDAYQAARYCGLNLVAQLKRFLGDLNRVKSIVQVKGYVACGITFENQPQVINGVSDLMVEIFGDAGRHTRCALGTNTLPANIPVEAELIAEVSP
ncbi:MAG: RidA family protein [Treponema sp.]|jgi:enamine deaminase RidA (YjgF/YER057c/UK114 family)|nr:RidA family protein [Treponema sp.]